MNKRLVVIGAFLSIVGAILLLYQEGTLRAERLYAITPRGEVVGIEMKIKRGFSIFSTVTPGVSYKWKVTLKNTGNVGWDSCWVTFRVGVNGAQVVKGDPETCDSDYGDCLVEKCAYGEDTPKCREQICYGYEGTWNFRTVTPGVFYTCDPSDKMAATSNLPALEPGESTTFEFALDVPRGKPLGSYPLILNGGVSYGGKVWIVDSEYDMLDLGTISGELGMTLVGALSLLGGIASIVAGFIKKP